MEANPRSLRKMRKQLSAPGLLDLARGYFEQVKDPCVGRCEYTLADTLMSGLAMFLFKSSSMLQFERGCRGEAADPVLQHNLERLYGVAKVPSDSPFAAAFGWGVAGGLAAGVRSGVRAGPSA